MVASYRRSLLQALERHLGSKLHHKKANQVTWIRSARSWIFSGLVASFCTHTSIAQTSVPQKLAPNSGLEVSVRELKIPNKVWSGLQAAHKALTKGNLQEAAKQTDRALGIDPQCAPALAMKALIDLARRKPLDAMQNARRATSVDPHYVEGFVVLAMAGNAADDFADSQRAAKEALTLEPDSWKAHLELAKSFYGEERLNAALLELNQLRKDFPDVHLVRGNILMRLGRDNESAQEFALFLREAPHDPRSPVIQQIIARTPASPRSQAD